MGEIADMMLEGILCQQCGTLIEDLIVEGSNTLKEAPGYPRSCSDCEVDSID
ncbi:hypothetical protein JZO72_08225 [Vagococcus fluvialis]|uniref:hypothetical protein n=1 Tax=Vagococcus fluvialis TaxID=2738 RepID=UPI001A8DBAC1|nr:hypothetical protein [Vagococcus fluvialis]MBO0479615.1 hypothetical protein [Vagococcus fluvialis]MBO0485369.1 hypothetical protein [Vagococcus fluvialis]